MWRCSIRALDKDGQPRRGVEVTMFGGGFLGGALKGYTNGDGLAEIENPSRDRADWIVDSIYVNHKKVSGSRRVLNGEKLSFTLAS